MRDPERSAVTQKYADHSTMETFSFSFFCDRCGSEWRSPQYAFHPGGFAQPQDYIVYQMLWNEQHSAAYERANRDASFVFNRCPICDRRVCDACFFLSGAGVSDICEDCLKKINKEEAPP